MGACRYIANSEHKNRGMPAQQKHESYWALDGLPPPDCGWLRQVQRKIREDPAMLEEVAKLNIKIACL
jgi:hypothetical protein